MERWTVQDPRGRDIYLTKSEWETHILLNHPELDGLLEDVLNTIRFGRRTQDRIRPNKYFYRYPCDRLPDGYTQIVVVVLFKPESNNYVVAAWGTD
jgi:hypothetical protein